MWQNSSRELNSTVFSRRAFILLVGKILIVGAIVIRLLILQVFKAKEYKTLSDKNRIKFILIPPKRGSIKDTDGNLLAYNKEAYKIYFYKQKGKPYKAILKSAFDILKPSAEQRSSLLKLVKGAAYLRPIVIKDNVLWNNIVKIEVESHKLPGVFVEKSFTRYYPLRENLAHVLGYTGLPNQNEIASHKLHHSREAKIGKTGIEKQLNHSLIGKFGAKKVEVNANSIIVRDLSIERSSPGNDVHLTIHAELQNLLHQLLPQSGGAAAAVEISTGNILAMCSSPSFDPNIFSTEFSELKWQELMNNKLSPFTNKVIGKAYPPGSVWKIITSLAILESGIDPEEMIFCTGSSQIGDRIFKCGKRKGHGYVNFHNALPLSCNCYFYKMGIRAGIENIHKTAQMLGVGQKIGFELSGELSGSNPNKQWKKKVFREEWTHGDTANASIGQGFVLATPLQLLMMISKVASGKIIAPSLLKEHNKNVSPLSLPFKKENLIMIRHGLINASNKSYGIGFGSRIRDKRFLMAGKTGTAQVISKDTSAEPGNFNKSLRSHSIFVGYAPIDTPKYAAVVVADNAGWGSATAAPIGRDILFAIQKKMHQDFAF